MLEIYQYKKFLQWLTAKYGTDAQVEASNKHRHNKDKRERTPMCKKKPPESDGKGQQKDPPAPKSPPPAKTVTVKKILPRSSGETVVRAPVSSLQPASPARQPPAAAIPRKAPPR